MKLMLCLMSELEKLVSFEGIQPAVYFARFSRWLVQELLAECATKFQQWDRSPESAMDAQDGHASIFQFLRLHVAGASALNDADMRLQPRAT